MNNKTDLIKNMTQEIRKGTLVLAVLAQLRVQHYGYSLVETMNDKGLRIDQNTLYPLLRRLDKSGLLDATWEVEEPRPRKYYQLNALGHEVLSELQEIFESNYQTVHRLLEEEQ